MQAKDLSNKYYSRTLSRGALIRSSVGYIVTFLREAVNHYLYCIKSFR